ncbi:MAG: hypothetical protein DRP27_09295 [Thermotogae bacterium]|nr:MAG: hypothetical protein DRP27_09295 [Thermotogota bacterium]
MKKGGGEQMKRIPRFESEEEEARFWDTHDVTDFLDDLEFEDIKFVRREPLTTVSFRIERRKVEKLKRLAKRLKVPYTVLIREIIDKALSKDRARI